MSLFTRDKVYISADKSVYIGFDEGTGEYSLVVRNVTVLKATSSALLYQAGIALTRASQKRTVNGFCKVGGTAGWTVGGGAVNTGLMATMAASQTAGKLVIPLPWLKVGDIITGFHAVGQIESAGGTVTLDLDLRKHTAAAADVADASVGAITQLSVTADTIISADNSRKADLSETVGVDESFYILATGTTAASTDIALQGVCIEMTES
jgi:hypothetical protein